MKSKIVIASLLFLVAISWSGFYIYKFEYREKLLEVTFLNLPKGRAIFIITPGSKTILVDGGETSAILRELSKLVPFYRRKIDILIARSRSDRVAGGLVDTIDRYEVGRVVVPFLDKENVGMSATSSAGTASTAFDSLSRVSAPERIKSGDILYSEDGLEFRAIFPGDDFVYSNASQPQLVLELSYGQTKIVFMGDATPAIQNYLAKKHSGKFRSGERVSLLEFSHSGAMSRVSAKALDIFRPEIKVPYSPKLAHRRFVSDGKVLKEK